MNPNSIPKRLKSWVCSLAAIFIAVTAFGHIIVQTGPPSITPGGSITIADTNATSSTVVVTNFVGHITRVTVTLNGVTHGYPDDIDIVLQGPAAGGSKQVKLFSDAGGQFDIGNTDVTLDSTASSSLPNEALITSGRYRPTDFDGGDNATETGNFAGGTDLGVFIDDDANGTWTLFVRDDTVVDSGSIRNWTLNIFTEPVLSLSTNNLVVNEDTAGSVTVFANDSDTPASGLTFTAVIPNSSTNLIAGAVVTAGTTGTNRVVTVTPRANQTGTGTVEIRVNDGIVTRSTNLTVTVNAVNDAPTIALNTSTTQVQQGGITTNILATVSDVDNDPATLEVIAITSDNPAVVPISNVFVNGSGTNNAVRHVRISPAANASSGSATITLRVRDSAGATNNANITVTVVPVPHVVAGNPAAITIPTNGTATPYPSQVTVQNVSGLVGEVTVTLLDVNHTQPDDMGILLVGPGGEKVVLMRGAGGTTAMADQRLVFDSDNGDVPSGTLTTSTNGPADYSGGPFPAPAPAEPYSTELTAFRGTSPNGTWSLYVYDQQDNTAGGSINGGWAINIFVAPVVGTIGGRTTPEDTPVDVSFSVTDHDGTVTNIIAQVIDASPIVTVSTNLSGSTGTVRVTPLPNQTGTNFIRVIAQDNQGFTGTNVFSIIVTPVNDLPAMSVIPKQIARAGQSVGPITFTVSDVETPPGNLEVRVTSNNPKLLPPGSLVLGGSGSTRTLTIFPAGAQADQADITVTVIDANGGSTSQTFDLTVEEAAFPLFANEAGITIRDNDSAQPYPSVINVSNLTAPIAEVQVTLFGITHPRPDDLDIMLVHPNGASTSARLTLMSDVGGSTPAENVTLIFRDSAAGPLGDETPIFSGAFDPSNPSPTGDFPVDGSPGDPTATTFAGAFNGLAANGAWSLYVVDDQLDTRGGVITSWQLGIRTRPLIAPPIADQNTPEDTPLRFTVDIGDAQPGVNFDIDTVVTGTPDVVDEIDIERSGDSLVITITPVEDVSGTNTIVLTVSDDLGNTTSDTFEFGVTPRNDAPRFSNIPNTNTPAASPITLPFTVVDVEGSAVTVTASSSDTRVVPNSAIVVSPATGTTTSRTVTITPAGILSGSTTITLTGTDASGAASTETFVLTVNPAVAFESTRNIVINDFAAASPYPSTIDVSGVLGTVSDVRLILFGFGHQYPDDVDILLVSPDNRRVSVMSDAGGSSGVTGRRLTFTSDAGAAIPNEGPLPTGVFLPSNYTDPAEGADVFPSPAPGGPYSSDLGSLDGVDPNGQWRLFVRDDTFQLDGEITGGWALVFETGPRLTGVPTAPVTTPEDVPAVIRFTVADQDTPASNLVVTASVSGNSVTDLVTNGAPGLVITGTDENRTLTIFPSPNLSGTNLVTISVTDGETSASQAFAFRVTAVDDPPTITTSTNRFVGTEDTQRVIPFTIGDIDSTVGTTNVTVVSSNPTLVPNSTNNISIGGEVNDAGDDVANETVTITPAANQFGSTTLTISVADATTTVTTNIVLEINPVNDIPTIQTSTNFVSVVAGQTSGIVNVRITDIETLPRNLVLSANSRNPSIIPNGNILLGGADTNRTAQFIAVSQQGTAVIELIVSDGGASATNLVTVEVRPAPGSVFPNPNAITIRDNNTAQPYPSTIVATGMRGPITRVSVTLDGLTHSAPDDIDILLVHRPTGTRSLIMSDAGGRNAVSNIRLTFDEVNAPRDLADESPIAPGTYSATDYAPADTFSGVSGGVGSAVSLANFNGVANANGEWDLYVVDDTAGDSGQIAFGWSLRIETAPTVVATPSQQTTNEDIAQVFDVTIDDMTTTNALTLSFANSNPSIVQSVTFTPNPITSPNLDVTVTPVPNATGTNVLTITVRNPSGAVGTDTVTNIWLSVADAPTMSRVVDQTTQEDRPVTFQVLINDVDTPLSGLWLEGTSGNQNVISSTNILIEGRTNLLKGLPENVIDITLQPNAGAVDTLGTTITLTLSEGGTNNLVSSNFVLRVLERNDPPLLVNTNANVAVPAGESVTINIQASDPEGLPTTVTATSSDQALVQNGGIVVTPSGGTTAARTVTITAQPGVQGRATITLVAADPANNRTTNQFTVDVRPTRERVFSNRGQIVINDNAGASPYPSTINVSGLVGTISKVTVTLHRFYHTFADDVDMLLVSPTGQEVLIWSDVGGDIDVTNIVIKLDDAALNPLPNNGPLVNGTFRPFNDDTSSDVFPSPAPAAPYEDTLADFNGVSPNGTWSLYVRDDTASDSGLIVEGWSLGVTTQPVLVGLANVTSPEDRPVTVAFTVAEESFAGTDFTFTATSSNPSVVPNSTNNIIFGGSGTNRTVTVIPAANASGSSTITVRLRNSDGQEVTGSFVATFTAVNDVPTITQISNQTVPLGGEVVVTNFFFSDVETERSFLNLEVRSSNPDVIPTNNVVIVGDEVRITSAGVPGRSTVTIIVSDPSGASASTTFEVVVAAGANPIFTNRDGIVIRDNNTAAPYPSTISVSNVAGTITKVTVTLNEFRHSFPDDVDILLVGPGGQNVVLLSDAGTGGDNTPAELENGRFVFDDAGTLPPDNAALPETGTFRPSNFEGSETFTAPAPAGPYGSALSVFNGTVANGTWSLYVVDDASPDAGSIGSWTLTFTTTAPTITQIPSPVVVREDTPTNILFQVNAPGTDPTNLVVNARIEGTPIISLGISGTGTDRTLTITPRANQTGTNVVTLTVADQTGASTNTASTTFTVVVQNVDNDAPEIGPVADQIADPGETVVVTIPVSDVDTPLSELTFIAGTAGTNIVESIDIDLGTNANTVVATIVTRPGANGTETITISVFDGQNLSRTSFELEVTGNRAPVIEPIANVQTPEDVSPTVRINVTDAETPLAQLTITGQASNTNLVSGVSIANNGTTVQATINLRPNAFGTSTITISANDGTNTATSAFTLTVLGVAECPVLGPIANQSGAAGATIRVPLNVTDQDTALTDLTFLSGTAGNAVVQNITFEQTATSVTAVITLQAGATGSETVTIRALEGECSPATQSFTLTVGNVIPPAATLAASRSGTNFVLTITGQPGATYAVEGTSDFASWTQVGTVTIGAGGTATLTIPANRPFQFFRTRGGDVPAPAPADAYEGYGYPAGTLIGTNTSGGTGWTAAWRPDAETPTNHTVLSPGLEYSDASGRGLITTPGSAFYTATTNNMPTGGDVRSFRILSGGVRSNGTSWISFIGQRMGPTVTNTGTPNNLFPRAANLSFYEGTATADGTERFAIGNGSGAVSNLWSILPAGSVGNVTNDQRSATPMNQQALIVLRIDHIEGANDNMYMWVNPSLGSEPSTNTAAARSIGAFSFSFDRVRPFAGGNDTGANRPYAELALDEIRVGDSFASVTPHVQDLTAPFNAVAVVNGTNDADTAAGAPPANEGVERVIDNVGQKYLNFLDFDSGFIVTPLGSTVVNALRFWPANDATERDPTSYRLEGSTAGAAGPWTLISEGPLNLPLARNTGGVTTALRGGTQELVRFNNTTPYTSYRVTFPTIRNAGTANSMQIAEVDFHFIP